MSTQLALDAPPAPSDFPPGSVQRRFWSKVQLDADTGCWQWTACTADGYGRFHLRRGKVPPTHRLSYEWLVGPIPEGLHIDHLCRNRGCVNPDHLEPVTPKVNILRGVGPSAQHAVKTHCPSGHEYTTENTYKYRGMRMCVECRKEASRKRPNSRAARQVRSNPADPRHGTITAYYSYLCRCDRCKSAAAAYQREYAAGKRRRIA